MRRDETKRITFVAEESWQWLGSACNQQCAHHGCPNKATWRRTYQNAQMPAPGFYYECDEHVKPMRDK
jgi:hypothetical protein